MMTTQPHKAQANRCSHLYTRNVYKQSPACVFKTPTIKTHIYNHLNTPTCVATMLNPPTVPTAHNACTNRFNGVT